MSFSGRYPEHDICENFNAVRECAGRSGPRIVGVISASESRQPTRRICARAFSEPQAVS
jgi:hypothetical protein